MLKGSSMLGNLSETAPVMPEENRRASGSLPVFLQRFLAEELVVSQSGAARVATALSSATVDLNPHQIEAAAFALESLDRGGAMLADEVGLGKTVEAGIVINQLTCEGRGRILILCPASLRAQWQSELLEKFGLRAICVDGSFCRSFRSNPFEQHGPVIASIPFGANRASDMGKVPWDLVVIDEAHRLRNAWRPNHKTGKALRIALEGRPKLLLTATPLQNDLMELYGLISLLDDSLLGPEHAFRSRYVGCSEEKAQSALLELKQRIAPVVQRTLRRQVREYVKYTARRSMVEDFTPSPPEQDLYEKVSEYLRRSDLLAIEPGRRTLLTLVYRKLLASSTYAIAPTLRRLADGLEARVRAAQAGKQFETTLSESEREELREFDEELEELDGVFDEEKSAQPSRPPATLESLQSELCELRAYAALAESIRVNAKGEALCGALDRTFSVAAGYQWPQKAVVFTESKRTQEYLFQLLSERGYAGKISKLSGDGSTPEERRTLVETFRDRTQILLSTEAGAEGLNLQFCNLVVNYDLPWNPQRVEQRIGRCHRYGQTRDVLVLNFVNRSNAADARLYELLEKKLTLFDGVFGASDEILGGLESGVDFERRVLDIYQSCRTEGEINKAFAVLRCDLESRIDERMAQARDLLLSRFEGDVRSRLRIAGAQAKAAISRRKNDSRALAKAVLGNEEASPDQIEQVSREVREKPAPAISYLSLNTSELPPRLSSLAGKEGWWFLYRFTVSGSKPPERLVHLMLIREGERYQALSLSEAEMIARLSGKEAPGRAPAVLSVSSAQEEALAAICEEIASQAQEQSEREVDLAREKAMRYCEDCLLSFRDGVTRARTKWEEARKALVEAEDRLQRIKARAAWERTDREYRRKMGKLRSEEDQQHAQLDRTLSLLAVRSKINVTRVLIATAYFWLD